MNCVDSYRFRHKSTGFGNLKPQPPGLVAIDVPNPYFPGRMINIALPEWVSQITTYGRVYASTEERMRLAIDLARHNVLETGGGPFGAAVFEQDSGRLVGVGVNLVVPLNNSVLHAEIVAFMDAESRVESYTLAAEGMVPHEVVTSCEPCAMCLGASLWAGVSRIVYGATREDAAELRFDEGPVFPQSYEYLAARGISIVPEVLRAEARSIFKLYRDRQGPIYNA
jgi:tRNA(Arg) A34 adenosine deaminase TadA